VRSVPLVIVEGTLQRDDNNINVIAKRLHPIEDSLYPFRYPDAGVERNSSSDGVDLDPDQARDVDPSTIQLVRLSEDYTHHQSDSGPRSRAELRAISPDAHNYR